jgi:hypothetical protein
VICAPLPAVLRTSRGGRMNGKIGRDPAAKIHR